MRHLAFPSARGGDETSVRLPRGTTKYCPYCYEEISGRQLWFRCTGRISRSGKRCAPQVDAVLRARTGFTGALPPAFAADGRRDEASCPECEGETRIRICPVCHSRLPVHFAKVGSRLIVPVGAKEAGKTVFMTVLVHELMHQISSMRPSPARMSTPARGSPASTNGRCIASRGYWHRPRPPQAVVTNPRSYSVSPTRNPSPAS